MATLRELIGKRAILDNQLCAHAGRDFDELSPEQQRAAYIHARRVIHEVQTIIQLARDGHTLFTNDRELLQYVEQLAWANPKPPQQLCPGCNRAFGETVEPLPPQSADYQCQICGRSVIP
jgi:hypothetical protein